MISRCLLCQVVKSKRVKKSPPILPELWWDYHVLERETPDADKLSVCKVDNGRGDFTNCVWCAQNVRAGLKAPLALIGAYLTLTRWLNLKLKGKLRGIESFGSASSSELGALQTSRYFRVVEPPADAPVGADIRDYLKLNDEAIELAITANRGDCASGGGCSAKPHYCWMCAVNPAHYSSTSGDAECILLLALLRSRLWSRYAGRVTATIRK